MKLPSSDAETRQKVDSNPMKSCSILIFVSDEDDPDVK